MTYVCYSRRGRRRGAVIAQVAICITLLLGVAALTLDGGILMAEQQHAQATADAAALAAAVENMRGGTNPTTAATNVASANGYTNDTTHSVVTVKLPGEAPLQYSSTIADGSSPGTLKTGYYEVTVQWNQTRFFSGIFGSSGTIPVKARAVARATTTPSYWNASILVLNRGPSTPLSGSGLDLTGGSQIQVPGAVLVDSSASNALNIGGSGGWLKAPAIDLVGGYTITAGDYANPTPLTGQAYTPDPLASLAEPSIPSPPSTPPSGGSFTWSGGNLKVQSGSLATTTTIYPGAYTTITVARGTLIMKSGVYYLTGDNSSSTKTLLVSGASSAIQSEGYPSTGSGYGVLIYNGVSSGGTSSGVGKIDISAGGTVNLVPMSSGTYQGINIFQDRNASTLVTISGGSGTNIAGMVYAAKAEISATGGSTIVPGSSFISDTLLLSGGGTMIVPAPSIPVPVPGGGGGGKVGLVE